MLGRMRSTALRIAIALLAVGCTSPAPSTPGGASSPSSTLPAIESTAPTPSLPTAIGTEPAPSAGPDYQGDWAGVRLAGTLKYCGSTTTPYWGADIVTNSGDRAFLAYDIPAGSTEPVAAEFVTPFVSPDWTKYADGTGQFVPGNPPHFIVENGEGTYDVTLEVGKFCNTP